MTVCRSVVIMVPVLLLTSALMLVHTKDVTTMEYDDLLPATETNIGQRIDTDTSIGDNRQGRMSLHAELPSSKAKREQALRNILAARRRQILSQRPFELTRNVAGRTSKPDESSLKDSTEILEVQETRHGLYVTATANVKAESSSTDEEAPESLTKILDESNFESTSEDPKDEFTSESSESKQTVEQISREPNIETSMVPSIEIKAISVQLKNNYSIGNKSSSSESSSYSSTSSPFVSNSQKSSDVDSRKKNTVSMPESLYNYFRPVESNIPVEDMSQFLYFGQKLQPEVQNTTGNNSVEVTPTVPTAPSSRRRYSMKRFSTTTPAPIPKLEEIINEEMNIAVERQTIEKNKVSKIKNTFRSLENGLYYRKSRPTDPTITSNVILMKESGRNTTETGTRIKTDLPSDKFHGNNPSAHATIQDQLQHASERGSVPTHVLAETRNATNSTQIPHQQPVSVNVYNANEESIVESEISFQNRPTDVPNDSSVLFNGAEDTKVSKIYPRRRKADITSTIVDTPTEKVSLSEDVDDLGDDTVAEYTTNVKQIEMYNNRTGYMSTTANTYDTIDRFNFAKKSDPIQVDQPRSSNARENNNIETSTSRNKVSRTTTETPFLIAWTTLSERAETSTLRIIVTEKSYDESSAIESDLGEKNTVKPVDTATDERVHAGPSGDIPTTKSTTMSSFTSNSFISQPRAGEATTANLQERHQHQHQRQQQHQQQQQQQHVYAYTITNVTRLLRNYTGPGLSKEEQGGHQRSTGTAEITTGSPQRRQPPPPSLLLLPRAGSSIEAVRAPAELSTGTTVEPAAAGEASGGILVGERQRKLVAVLPQSQQRALTRPSSLRLTVNKSTSRPSKSSDVSTRGSIRWNHTKTRNLDQEGANDRRFLRKSASAVLNQRIGGSNADDDVPLIANKRRRVSNGTSIPLTGNRRVKGSNLYKNSEQIINSDNRSVGFNGSSLSNEKKKFAEEGKTENGAEGRAFGQTMHLGIEIQKTDNIDPKSRTMGDIMEQTKNLSTILNSTHVTTDRTASLNSSESTVSEHRSSLIETTTSMNENVEVDTKDKNAVVQSESESSVVEGGNATSSSSVGSADKNTDNRNGSSTVTVTETSDETIAPKEITLTTTTVLTPVFPVTPKIITEVGRVPIEKETFTLKPTETVNRETQTKTTDFDRPFGIAGNLDPSEIQKMYRSQSFTTTEAPVTSQTPTEIQPQNTFPPQEQSTDITKKADESTSSPVSDQQKTMPGERSPEVRARNLSDKSKDKDDVLPIMHLYNTSDIFNGSGSMDSFSPGAERPRIELPVDAEATDEKQPETSSTTEKVDDRILPKSTPNINEDTITSRLPLPNPKETSTQANSRKEKHDDNREVPSQVPPTGPGRGYTFVNGSTGNRTRNKPVYHHTILPEYNGSVYHDELNRTFFEAGLISVSPRESVNMSEVTLKRHDGDAIASQETVAVVSYILATLVVFPIAVGVGLILRRLILRNRKVLEESDTSSEISCRKDALNLENGDFKTSIEKAITKLPRIQHLCHEAEKPPPPSSQESRWEFPRDKLRLQTVLGQGNFGQVWKAEADDLTGHQGTTRLVAVKTVKEGASDREKEDLVRELEIMQQLGSHPNVVTLLGCCTEEEPHYLILEYVMYGKLLAYLRDHRTRQDFYNFSEDSAALTSRDLTVFGYCVARGMEYLASKKIIHRDLAARNVLVDHNKLCKIADFGMSRFANEDGEVIETRHGRNALPIRWMAPESLIYSLFTTKTDVWSFGILMWEIVTLGSTPYPDMTAREVMRNVQNGYRLERPSHCRSELFRVISRCWHADPDRRPEFQTLRRDLAQLLEDNMNGHYVDLESFASECTD